MTAAVPHSTKPLRAPLLLALLAAMAWLGIAVWCLPDFGPTWDSAELHHGDVVLGFLADPASSGFDATQATPLRHRSPAPELTTDIPWTQCSVVSSTVLAASCWLLWDRLDLLPAMAAYLFGTALLVALLIAALVFVGERWAGRGSGVFAATLLLLQPRFLAEALGNHKDAPEAVLFAFAVMLGCHALLTGRRASWILCGILGGIAAALKANGLFVPFVLLPFVLLAWWRRREDATFRAPSPWVLLLAAAAGLFAIMLVLPPTWCDPPARLLLRLQTQMALGNSRIGGAGDVDAAGGQWTSIRIALLTTPPSLLAAAIVGLFAPARPGLRALLCAWLLVPLLRTALPGMRHYDGIRHFLEFTVPLAWLAGLGCIAVLSWLRRRGRIALCCGAALALVPVAESAWSVAAVYPFGTCYWSPLVGGLAGAQRRGEPDTTDYWCSSYWAAAAWLSTHAEPDADLLVPIAPQVFTALAPVRLRPDLRLKEQGAPTTAAVVYVVYTTRTAFYPAWLQQLRQRTTPAFSIAVQGGPILEILRLDAVAHAETLAARLGHERGATMAAELYVELQQRRPADVPRLAAIATGASERGEAASLALLRELFPDRSDDDLRAALRPYLGR